MSAPYCRDCGMFGLHVTHRVEYREPVTAQELADAGTSRLASAPVDEREAELEALVADVSEEDLRAMLAAAELVGAAGNVALYLEALERVRALREDALVERRLAGQDA